MMLNNSVSGFYATPVGNLDIEIAGDKLVHVHYLLAEKHFSQPKLKVNPQLFSQVVAQINAYFANPQYKFTLPIELHGTCLQRLIWQCIAMIPAGETKTYGELAKTINTSPRVIGNACRSNPLPIIIPCHRVLAAKGIGGYSGDTQGKLLQIKKLLLQHEGFRFL